MKKKKHIIFHPLSIASVVVAFFCSLAAVVITPSEALNQTYTVCPVGCDFTSLADALVSPGLSEDTVTMTQDYVFDYANETIGGTTISIPTRVTITCDPGADTFGDKTQSEIELSGSSDITLQSCSTENVKISLFGTNVNLLNNTFSSETDSWIILTGVDGYEISGNTGIQRIQLQGADNGVIENNEIECRFSGCVNVVTAGAPDYNDPMNIDPNISNNVLITDNTITNYATNNIGDWVLVNGGKNIQFTNNTILSDVVMDDIFMTLVSIQNAQAEFTGNNIVAPEKTPGATQVTWAFNIRSNEYEVDAVYEHNTIIAQNGDSCFGLFDDGTQNNRPFSITTNYNLCYQSNPTPSGNGFSLNLVIGSVALTLNDSYNGIYNMNTLIADTSGVFTALNANTVTKNPLLRLENADTNDDLFLSPVSNYLDVNGTEDIGAYSDTRVNSIFINENCTVDYMSCHGTSTSILTHALRTGDTSMIMDGTYDSFAMTGPLNNVTIMGGGPNTMIDAAATGSAINLIEVSNSQIQNLQVQNSNASVSSVYEITHQLYEYNSNTYDQSTAAVGSPNIALLFSDANCNVVPLSADATNVDAAVGAATDDWNLGLIDLFGSKMTILVPDRFVSSGANLISYVLNNCGAPITVDLFLPSIFTVNSGNYTYNAAAAALAGVSLKPGLTTPPELSHIVTVTPAGGIFLENSSNNIFQSVSITNNTIGAYLDADSNGNTFLENTFSSNSTYDISTVSTGNNQLDQSTFDLNKIEIGGTGLIQVYFKARALVQNGATPIENASVTFTDALNNIVGPLLTDASGLTAYTTSMLAIVLDQSNPHVATAGGLNPFTAEATTINGVSYITENLISRDQQFTIGAGSKRRSLTEECVDCSDEGETETPAPTSGSGSPTTTTPNPTQPTHPSAPNTVVKPTFSGYTDLPENDLDYAAFKYAYEQGIVTGNPDGSARPEDFLQRDQAAKMIATFSPDYSTKTDYCDGKKPFRDILSTFWGAQEICFGKQIGAITGYTEDRTYLPTNWMNRAEFLALILRSMPNLELPTSGTDSYRDVLPRKWYSLFAKFAFDQSLFAITSEQKLFPDNFITRREATLIIYALREYR